MPSSKKSKTPKAANTEISPQVIEDAAQMAKTVAKPGQSKEQTKLIEMGIRKGIQEYKKRQKALQREQDKLKKKTVKEKVHSQDERIQLAIEEFQQANKWSNRLPWVLLLLSWVGFLVMWFR